MWVVDLHGNVASLFLALVFGLHASFYPVIYIALHKFLVWIGTALALKVLLITSVVVYAELPEPEPGTDFYTSDTARPNAYITCMGIPLPAPRLLICRRYRQEGSSPAVHRPIGRTDITLDKPGVDASLLTHLAISGFLPGGDALIGRKRCGLPSRMANQPRMPGRVTCCINNLPIPSFPPFPPTTINKSTTESPD